MNPPDARHHNPDPAYVRELIAAAGLSQRKAAHLIGVTERMMRYYCAQGDKGRSIPYPEQYCLERLAAGE